MCVLAHTGAHWKGYTQQQREVCKDRRFADAWGFCHGNQPHPGTFALPDPPLGGHTKD